MSPKKKQPQKKERVNQKAAKAKKESSKDAHENEMEPVHEIRKDYILDFEVLIADNRSRRPSDFKMAEKEPKEKNDDPFLPGNESKTPPEIGRQGTAQKWTMRWFENKFPLFVPQPKDAGVKKYDALFQSKSAKGFHEVIVGTNQKDRNIEDFTPKQLETLLQVYASEIQRHHEQQGVKYVLVFKNKGARAGTSIVHEHSQLLALPFVPPRVEQEISESSRYFRSRKRCIYCDVLAAERKGPRFIYENKAFMVFAPYASRFNFETWIMSKMHKSSFQEFLPKDYEGLADAMLFVVKKLTAMGLHFNIVIHYEPLTKTYKEKFSGLHFHIEILPRRQTWAGLEIGGGLIVNDVSPERAAEYFRGSK
jgi:UDPglucose--hexose-1-phosphate uridylyltransferase